MPPSTKTTKSPSKARGPCKFGERCTRSNCWFDHPTTKCSASSSSSSTTTTTTCFEIQPKSSPSRTSTTTTTTANNNNNNNDNSNNIASQFSTRIPYQFCSREECEERQELGQVSIFEATVDTASSSQRQRRLDPALAVAKYRRSAAGTDFQDTIPSHETLELLVQEQLLYIAATRKSTPNHHHHHASPHGHYAWQGPWCEFLVDRLRACQSNAIRLTGQASSSSSSTSNNNSNNNNNNNLLSLSWHAQMVRILIWIRYWMPWKTPQPQQQNRKQAHAQAQALQTIQPPDYSFLHQTIDTMMATAVDQYWSTCEGLEERSSSWSLERTGRNIAVDDEMLCYAALSRLAARHGRPNGNSTAVGGVEGTLLLDYSKHVPINVPSDPAKPDNERTCSYPLFQEALCLTAEIAREEYYGVLQRSTRNLPILARCCLAPALAHWRYRQCQQYNVSFAKEEAVDDLDRLLQVRSNQWTRNYADRLLGLPCQPIEEDGKDDGEDSKRFAVVFKQAAMSEEPPADAAWHETLVDDDPWHQRDDPWVFGSLWDKGQVMGISDEQAMEVLRTGRIEQVTWTWATFDAGTNLTNLPG